MSAITPIEPRIYRRALVSTLSIALAAALGFAVVDDAVVPLHGRVDVRVDAMVAHVGGGPAFGAGEDVVGGLRERLWGMRAI